MSDFLSSIKRIHQFRHSRHTVNKHKKLYIPSRLLVWEQLLISFRYEILDPSKYFISTLTPDKYILHTFIPLHCCAFQRALARPRSSTVAILSARDAQFCAISLLINARVSRDADVEWTVTCVKRSILTATMRIAIRGAQWAALIIDVNISGHDKYVGWS